MSIEKDAENLISALHPYRKKGESCVTLKIGTDRVSAELKNDVKVVIMYADDSGDAFTAQAWRNGTGSPVFSLTRNSGAKLQRLLNSVCS